MYLPFFEDEIFAVTDVTDHVKFASALSALVEQISVLSLIQLEPTDFHQTFFSDVPNCNWPSNHESLDRILKGIRESGYPNATAFNFFLSEQTPLILEFASRVSKPEAFADHVLGWLGPIPAMSFHDAFCGDAIYCSPKLDWDLLRHFATLAGGVCQLIKHPGLSL